MLIQCPECELQVSDKAIDCPHCGYPMKPDIMTKKRKKSNRRKRLPNGFGQITELKGRNLRKPFRAMVTVGKNEKGKPICKLLQPVAYFTTYNEAYAALVEYNRNPYDLDKATMTMQKLYDEWSEPYYAKLKSDNSVRAYKSAWKYCSMVYNMKVSDVRARHIKGCIEDGVAIIWNKERKPTANVKINMKTLFNLMLDYALEFELVDKNYSRTFKLSEDIIEVKDNRKVEHMPFSDDEIQKLWDSVNSIGNVDLVLIQCYSGWRPQELGLIKVSDVDIKKWTFKGGMKTEAGTDRMVPIHPRIRQLVKNRYNEAMLLNSEYLLNCTDARCDFDMFLSYNKYKKRFNDIVSGLKLNPEHRPHDGRKHFITMAKKYKVDEYAIKYMVGHVIDDITEKIYTVREESWLIEEMQKIK